MSVSRITTWTLLLTGGFALLTNTAAVAQDPQLPRKPDTSLLTTYRTTVRGGIEKKDLPEARKAFAAVGKYYADVISNPAVWKASQEMKSDPFSRVPTIDGPNGILHELDRFLLVPAPNSRDENTEPADYIRELGAALDAPLKNLIETHQERIVRINAARVLAHVCRTGAPAHFTTVHSFLADPKTPTEVKYYLFQGAGGLLAAYDPTDLKVRLHAANPKVIGELVKTLQECITNPAMILPGYKAETATPEQLAVIAFVRRQAVRALGQVKFVSVPGPDGTTPLYPAHTLARVALGDPALVPTPGPAESAEAVIGLCNMAPVRWQVTRFVPVKEYNSDVALEAILQALVTFAGPRAANPGDRSLPWRSYALRIGEAMYKWRPLFDPDFDVVTNKFDAKLVPPAVDATIKFVAQNILYPIDKGDAATPVNIQDLKKRLSDLRANPKRKTLLFEGVKGTSIEFAPPKK